MPPSADSEGQDHAQPMGGGSDSLGGAGALAPRLLFVDDDAYMRRLIAARFEHLGAQVAVVASAQACLNYLEHTRPDVIVSDAVMPVTDGFALCRILKGDPAQRDIPFIILTALTRDLAQRSAQAGADDYLSKLESDTVFRLRARLAFRLGERRRDRAAVPAPAGPADLLVISAARTIPTQLGSHLVKEAIRPREAADLADALRRIQEQVPDLLVLDLAFGQKAVMEWLMRLRTTPGCEQMPILALAAKDDEGWLAGLEPHIQDLLPKPLNGQESRHRVNLLLQTTR